MTDCIPHLFACRIRASNLEADGTPSVGAGNIYVSDALAIASLTPNYKDGQEISETNACGATAIDVQGPASLVRGDLSLDFLTPDPLLHAILIAGSVLLAGPGGTKGWAFPPIGEITGNGISVEIFASRYENNAPAQDFPYAQWAIPLVRNARLGQRDFGNNAQHSLITAECYENSNWGDGPANDFGAASTRIAQWIPYDGALPEATCSYATAIAS